MPQHSAMHQPSARLIWMQNIRSFSFQSLQSGAGERLCWGLQHLSVYIPSSAWPRLKDGCSPCARTSLYNDQSVRDMSNMGMLDSPVGQDLPFGHWPTGGLWAHESSQQEFERSWYLSQ